MKLFRRSLAAAAVAALWLSAATAQETVAIRAGKVLTMRDGAVENAVILIERGRIKAVGTDIEVPWNAKVVDATDKVVAPAWVLAHANGGIGGANERMANVPFISVKDGIDPSSLYFEELRRDGVGTVHVIPGNATLLGGEGMIIRPYGKIVEDMIVREKGGLKLSLMPTSGSRMAQIRGMRNAFTDALEARAEVERAREEWEKMKKAGAVAEDAKFEDKVDELKQPILDLIDGTRTGWLYVPTAAEVPEVARMQEQYPKLKLVLVLGPKCYEAAERIQALGLPVVFDDDAIEYVEKDPETEAETVVCPPKVLADAGVKFAISVSDSSNSPRHFPWWQMATMVRHGMDREEALRTLTTRPAEILGLEKEVGAIAPGMTANVQVLSGDPLLATSWVETLILDGQVVYERANDPRLKFLFGQDVRTGEAAK